MTVRITGVTATIVSVLRIVALHTAYGSRDDATTVLVQLATDAGHVGLGQVPVDPPYRGAAGIKANIDAYLAPVVVGQSPLAITALVGAMERTLPGQPLAVAAVELALWDAKGKALGVPVFELLGGRVRDGLSLMAMVQGATPDALAAATREALGAAPYPVLKLKIGLGATDDLRRYRAVRDAAGDRAVIQVDANAGYTLAEAIPALGAMADAGGLGMIEQPVARLDDLAALAAHSRVPIMADESLGSPADMLRIVERRAAHAGFLKIGKVGGLLAAQQIAHIAAVAGMPLSVAVYYDVLAAVAAHAAAAFPAVTWPSFVTRLPDTLLAASLQPDGLALRVPQGPGWGIALDPDKVRHYTVAH